MVASVALKPGEELILVRAENPAYGIRLHSTEELHAWAEAENNASRSVTHAQYFWQPKADQIPAGYTNGNVVTYDTETGQVMAMVTDDTATPIAVLRQAIDRFKAGLPDGGRR